MKTFRNIVALALFALAAALPNRALAWDYTTDYVTPRANPSTGHMIAAYTTTDVAIALRVRFEGTAAQKAAGPTADVDATTREFAFTTDGTTADTTVGDGDGTTTDGIIDTDDAAYNTWGEVCDDINASSLWECTLVGVLPSGSSDGVVVDFAETSTTTGLTATGITGYTRHGIFDAEGLEVALDTSDADFISLCIGPETLSDDRLTVYGNKLGNRRSTPLNTDRALYWTPELEYVYAEGGPGGTLSVIGVSGNGASAIEETLWYKTLPSSGTPATTSTHTLDLRDALNKIRMPRGWHIVVKLDKAGSAITTGTLQVSGLTWGN